MKKLLLIVVAMLCTQALFAQLKVGDNPTTINKSSILELESHYQGLLLTRITDTTADINPLIPPNGMIIYFTDSANLEKNAGLYVRVNGGWQQMSSAASLSDSSWTLRGNANTDSTKNFLGTTDNRPLIIKTNNTERLRVEANGQLIAAPGTINNGTDQLQVVVIDPVTGDILQRTVPASIFDNAIVSLNNLRDTVQKFEIDSSGTAANFNITSADSSGVGIHTFHLPFQTGSGAVSWGLLSDSDWVKFDSAAKAKLLYSAFTDVPDARGVTINGDSIVLHAASLTTPGGVSVDAQTFGGSKTFADSVTVRGNTRLDSVLTLTTSPSAAAAGQNYVLIRDSTTGDVVQRQINTGAFKEVITGHDSSARDIFIDSSSATTLKINIPYASDHVNGIVDTVSQVFGGNKIFADSVSAAVAVNIGSTANANSTLQLTGSLAMSITNAAANYTVTGTDNTVLANCTSSALIVTLPPTAGIAGRMITIKKVGTGGINNQLTINPQGGAFIDGTGTGYTIYNDWTFVTLQTDGTNWYIIKR